MDVEPFEVRWIKARNFEAAGDVQSALDTYEAILADEPARLYARLRASTLYQMQGHYRCARKHAVEAVEAVRHSRWSDLPHVTSKLLTFDEHRLLLELLHGVNWSHPDVIAMSPMLTQHLWLSGAVKDALRMAEIALKFAPEHAQLNYAHGLALAYSGRINDALASFEKSIRLDKTYAVALWSLAYTGRRSSEFLPGARAEAALRSAPAPIDRPYLHYAAFKELHDAGQHDAAWSHLMEGAHAKREMLAFDELRESAITQWLLSRMTPEGAKPDPYGRASAIFIVGMPRTGTTVLDRILGNHPGITSAGELTDFRSAANDALDKFIGAVPDTESMEALMRLDLQKLGLEYLERTRWRAENASQVVVDKHPENFFLSGVIMDALPSVRMICMRRNPVDACFSNLKELFANQSYGYSYDLSELANHYARFDELARGWSATRPSQFLLVDYEDLVTSPEQQSKRIFEFIGLPYSSKYSDITLNNSAVTTASASQIREPVTTKNIGAWRPYARQLRPLIERLVAVMPASEQSRIDAT